MENQADNNFINTSLRDVYVPGEPLTESYIKGVSKQPLVNCSIWEALEKQVCKNPDRLAFVFSGSGEELTFKQLHDQASDLANGLLSMGCSKGDRILTLFIEDKFSSLLFLASAAIGAIFCQPYIYAPYELYLRRLLDSVKPKVVISNAGPEAKMYKALLDLFNHGQTQGTEILTVTPYGTFNSVTKLLGSQDELTKYSFDVKADDPVWILTSSGTTGQSKLIVHSHKTLINASVVLNNRRRNQTQEQVVAIMNPMDDDLFCWMQMVATIITEDYRVTPVIMPKAVSCSSGASEDMAKQMAVHKCTYADLYPNIWYDLIVHDYLNKYKVTTLKGGATGSQIMTHFLERVSDCGIQFMNMFGTTEMLMVSSTFDDDPVEQHNKKSIGLPFPHVEIKIVNDAGHVLPTKETGEILVRSPYQFLGYFNDLDLTDTVMDTDRWYHTGDMGYLESDGFLYILGRKSDQIRYKYLDGMVYPATVENAAKKHPSVAEAHCVGIPNKNFEGDDIYLCLRLKDGCNLTEQEIRKFCENQLIERDYPAFYLLMDQFSKVGARQKVSKARLRSEIVDLVKSVNENNKTR